MIIFYMIWKNISLTIESNVSVILRIIGFGHGCTIFVYCQIQSLRFSTKKISKAHLSIRFHFTKEPCDCKYSYQSTRIENWQPLNIQAIIGNSRCVIIRHRQRQQRTVSQMHQNQSGLQLPLASMSASVKNKY